MPPSSQNMEKPRNASSERTLAGVGGSGGVVAGDSCDSTEVRSATVHEESTMPCNEPNPPIEHKPRVLWRELSGLHPRC